MILIAAPDGAASETDTANDEGTPARHYPRGEARIEVQRQHGPAVDSTALTQEGLPAELTGGASDHEPRFDEETEYRLAPEPFDAGPADSALSAPPVLAPGTRTGAPAAATWNDDSPAHVPSADWTSASTNQTRQILLVGFLGFAGVILALLLFVGFLRWYTKDASNASPSTDRAAVVPPTEDTATEDTATEGTNGDRSLALESGDTRPAQAADDAASRGQVATGDAEASALLAELPAAEASSTAGETGSAADGPSGDAMSGDAMSGDAINGDAINGDAMSGDAMNDDATSDAKAVDGSDAAPTELALDLPKRLKAFAPMLQYEIQPQFSDATEILTEAPVTAEDLGLTTTVDAAEIPAIDLAARSKVVVPAVVFGELPLSQFVSLWSNMSGIPTCVNFDSLAAAGIDRSQSLGLAMVQSATLGSLVERLGASIGLQAAARDNRYLELVAPDSEIEKKLPASLSLAGLVAPEAEAWLIESLPLLLPEHSLQWKIEDGKLLRPLTDSGKALDPLAWFSAVRLIEGWRQAAGLASTLPEYEPSLLSARLVAPSDVAGLDFELQQVQPEARPLSQIIPRICREAGLQAWLDWPALASVGVGPQTTALVLTSQRPLRRALADYASEFSLVVAVLDEQTLWLTSNQAYRRTPHLYVIPSNGDDANQWKSRLRPLTPAATGESGVGAVVTIATPDGSFILTRCCPMVVDFQ